MLSGGVHALPLCAVHARFSACARGAESQWADRGFVLAACLLLLPTLSVFLPCFCAWLEQARERPALARAGHSTSSPSAGRRKDDGRLSSGDRSGVDDEAHCGCGGAERSGVWLRMQWAIKRAGRSEMGCGGAGA